MSNFYRNLNNIDNANSLDLCSWFTEARGLDLQKLDAEETVESCEEVLEWAEPTLAQLVEEGKAARKEMEKAKDWDWESSVELAKSHFGYVVTKYRRMKSLIEETKAKLEIALDGLKDSEEESCVEVDDSEEEYNKLHFAGCRKAGEERFRRIMWLRSQGMMTELKMECMFRTTEAKYENRELTKRDYLKINAHLASWLGWAKRSQELFSALKAMESKPSKRWVCDVVEEEIYDMSMEDMLDLKRRADKLVEKTGMSFELAIEHLLEQ